MLHGNPLLRGWTVTDVSFYTTELPEYMLVEHFRGLNADVLHVSAAISYTLVVLIGAMLGRGRATGREGVVRMLIAAGIMIAPQLGPGVFILVFQPDHIGTQAPLLLTWLVLDRAGGIPSRHPSARAWWVPILVGAMLAWVEVADRLALLIGVAPLAAVSAIRAYQALVQRREGLRAAWFDLSLLLAAAASAEIASGVVKRIGEHGGFAVLPVANALAPVTEMSAHSWLAVESIFGLYGADFFGISSPGLDAAIAFLHLIGLALAVWGLWLVIRRFFSCEDRIAQVLALGILINVGAYLLSTTPTTYWSAREMAGVLPAGAVLAGRMLGGRFLASRLVPAMTVVLACYLAALGYTVAQPSQPAITQDLADWLVAHHLTYGLSSYGVGNATTLASGGAVNVRSVSFYNNDAAPGPYEFDQTWYDPRLHDANFVVLMNPPTALDQIATWEIRDAFGRPSHVYDFGPYVIMTYDTNLLTDLSPPRPLQPRPQPPVRLARGVRRRPGRWLGTHRRWPGRRCLPADARAAGPSLPGPIGTRREQGVNQGSRVRIAVRVAHHHGQRPSGRGRQDPRGIGGSASAPSSGPPEARTRRTLPVGAHGPSPHPNRPAAMFSRGSTSMITGWLSIRRGPEIRTARLAAARPILTRSATLTTPSPGTPPPSTPSPSAVPPWPGRVRARPPRRRATRLAASSSRVPSSVPSRTAATSAVADREILVLAAVPAQAQQVGARRHGQHRRLGNAEHFPGGPHL